MAVRNRIMCDGQRADNAHIAECIAMERGEARQREVENGQRPCSRMDSSGKGKWASEKGRERVMHL